MLIEFGCRAAFEFRHESWFVPEVYDLLVSYRSGDVPQFDVGVTLVQEQLLRQIDRVIAIFCKKVNNFMLNI